MSMFFCTKILNGLGHKLSRSFAIAVDILCKSFVSNIKAREQPLVPFVLIVLAILGVVSLIGSIVTVK